MNEVSADEWESAQLLAIKAWHNRLSRPFLGHNKMTCGSKCICFVIIVFVFIEFSFLLYLAGFGQGGKDCFHECQKNCSMNVDGNNVALTECSNHSLVKRKSGPNMSKIVEKACENAKKKMEMRCMDTCSGQCNAECKSNCDEKCEEYSQRDEWAALTMCQMECLAECGSSLD